MESSFEKRRLKYYEIQHLDKLPQLKSLTQEEQFDMRVVAQVLPFRTNNYVVEELIDWEKGIADPIFQLTFMHRALLESKQFGLIADALNENLAKEELNSIIRKVRFDLNPHPAGQLTHNVPIMDEEPVNGVQHKYKETALVFPSAGQTCFAYCTFCFRWPQFIGDKDLKFATDKRRRDLEYIREHKEITDILITGGDPLVMDAKHFEIFLSPFLTDEFSHIRTIRIGTKVLSYWPYRFCTDNDSAQLLALFKRVVDSGRHLAFMAHFNHAQELRTPAVAEAVERIRSTGAVIRTQSPVLRNVNDNPEAWLNMWKAQVQMGMVPYYMFVERDTGPKAYFEVPLHRCFEIYSQAYQRMSGLGRTARGPSMSAFPGKVCIEGVSEVAGEKVFVLKLLQARNPEWCNRIFFAKYDEKATWLTGLKPAFGEEEFFYESELKETYHTNQVR